MYMSAYTYWPSTDNQGPTFTPSQATPRSVVPQPDLVGIFHPTDSRGDVGTKPFEGERKKPRIGIVSAHCVVMTCIAGAYPLVNIRLLSR